MGSTKSVNITFPGGIALEMDVSQPEIAHSALLTQLFSEEFTRDGVLGWLAREQQNFSISDERLVAALEESLCDPIPNKPLSKNPGALHERVITVHNTGRPNDRIDLVILGDGYTRANINNGKFRGCPARC